MPCDDGEPRLLIAAPFTLNFSDGETGITAFYIVAGVAVLAVSLITNYQYNPDREWNTRTGPEAPTG